MSQGLVWHSALTSHFGRPLLGEGDSMNRIRNLRYLLLPLLLVWLGASAEGSAPPALGATAPDFKLQDQTGKFHELKDYRGKWVVLYFYPKDNTPGCTTQACELRDNIFAFRDAGAQILGVSVDDVESHKGFSEKHGLPFPILADSTKEVTKKYGVLKTYLGTMELAKRDTFLIDPQGKIVKHYPDVDPKGHSQMVLNDIKALQQKKS